MRLEDLLTFQGIFQPQGDVRKFADISLDAYGREQPCFNLDHERTIETLAERGVFDIPQIEKYLDSRGFR